MENHHQIYGLFSMMNWIRTRFFFSREFIENDGNIYVIFFSVFFLRFNKNPFSVIFSIRSQHNVRSNVLFRGEMEVVYNNNNY